MFDPLRPALRQMGGDLGLIAGCSAWALATMAALLLARAEWMVAVVAIGGGTAFALIPRWRRRWRIFALVAVSLAVFLSVSEALIRLRYFGRDALAHSARYQPIGAMANPAYLARAPEPGVIYTLRPGFDGWVKGVRVTANSLGLRDREWSVARHPGRLRVMTLGTSLAMGEGVAVDDTFTRVLGRLLERAGVSVEMLGFGVGGHTLGANQALLEARGLRFRPAVVIQELMVTAVQESDRTAEELRASFERTLAAPPRASIFETNSFALYAVYPPISLRQRLARLTSARAAVAADVDWRYLERALERFATLGADHGFRGVVFVPRPMQALARRELHRPERDQIRTLAERRGLVYVDSYDRFSGADVVEDLIIFPGDLHPNARAHARHADALARALAPLLRAVAIP